MGPKPYETYTIAELAADAFFQQWVLSPDSGTDQYWQSWLVAHPDRSAVAAEARKLIQSLHLPGGELTEEAFGSLWTAIDTRTLGTAKPPVLRPLHSRPARIRQSSWLRWAAVLAGFLLVAALYAWFRPASERIFSTDYGQTATITLPDGSVVTLNGNSSVRYGGQWNQNQPREVWLYGEAFFSVVHTQNHQRFLVHTSDGFNVEVLGTRFNVRSRTDVTEVVLSSGKVRLNRQETGEPAVHLLMQPGELVHFSDKSSGYVRKTVNPALYSAWRDKQLILDQTPLRQVVNLLEDTYGLRVEVADTTLLSRRISGMLSTERTDLFINGLAAVYKLKIAQNGKQVIIQPRAAQP